MTGIMIIIAIVLQVAFADDIPAHFGIHDRSVIKQNDLPWLGAIQKLSKDSKTTETVCSASIIDIRWALTAAHCLTDESGNLLDLASFQMVTGVQDLLDKDPEDRQEIKIDRVIFAHNFSRTGSEVRNDIALVRLKEAMHKDRRTASTINLPASPNGRMFECDRCTLVGWAPRENTANSSTWRPLEIEADIKEIEICRANYANVFLDKTYACFFSDENSLCSMYPGGSLFCRYNRVPTLVAIPSVRETVCGNPELHAAISVPEYVQWIVNNTRIEMPDGVAL